MRTDIAPAALAVLMGPNVPLVLLVDMAMSSPVRFASSSVDMVYSGNTYVGAGALGSVEKVRDATGEVTGLRFVLSGIPTEAVSLALQEQVNNKACSLRLAILDPDTHALLDAPIVWTGTLEQMPISQQTDQEGRTTRTITVSAQHRGVTFAKAKPLRYTDGDQQMLFPGDTSLRFVTSQANHADVWPSAAYGRQ